MLTTHFKVGENRIPCWVQISDFCDIPTCLQMAPGDTKVLDYPWLTCGGTSKGAISFDSRPYLVYKVKIHFGGEPPEPGFRCFNISMPAWES